MSGFRILLAVIFICIAGYTAVVIANHGTGLFAVFFGDIAKMGWPGQFNLDFLGFLTLSGLWLACVLTAYLFVASLQAKGDPAELFLGKTRAQRV
jgi:hypothetical protein